MASQVQKYYTIQHLNYIQYHPKQQKHNDSSGYLVETLNIMKFISIV